MGTYLDPLQSEFLIPVDILDQPLDQDAASIYNDYISQRNSAITNAFVQLYEFGFEPAYWVFERHEFWFTRRQLSNYTD